MAENAENTKTKILQSAKAEFLEKGFMAASLRTIAANAGLTTGAMYRHFKDKDTLFCALVDGAIEETVAIINEGSVENHENLENPVGQAHSEDEQKEILSFIEYLYQNFDAFTLLLTKAAGSTHEKFLEEISDMYTNTLLKTMHWLIQKYKITKAIDDMSIHFFANATINAFAEIVLHKMNKEEALVFIGNIHDFIHFGFMHMLGLPCED